MTLEQLKEEARKVIIYHITQEEAPVLTPDVIDTLITTAYEAGQSHGQNHAWMDAIELSDKLEESNTKFDEWRAFKGFRNALHDKIRKLSSPQTDVTN